MVPPNAEQVKTNMRKYYKQTTEFKALVDDLGIQLPSITKIDESFKYIVYKAGLGPLSSPTRSLLTKTAIHASQALHQGEVFRVHADNLTKCFQEVTTRKPYTRKRVQSGGRLRVEDTQEAIKKKDRERAKKEAQAKQKMLDFIKRRA